MRAKETERVMTGYQHRRTIWRVTKVGVLLTTLFICGSGCWLVWVTSRL